MSNYKDPRIFYWENPNNNKVVRVSLSSIEDIASERGDDRRAEDMDDESFNHYCDIYFEHANESGWYE